MTITKSTKPLPFSALRVAYKAAHLGCRYRVRSEGSIERFSGGHGLPRSWWRVTPREEDRPRWSRAIAAQRASLTPKQVSALAYAAEHDRKVAFWYGSYDASTSNTIHRIVFALRSGTISQADRALENYARLKQSAHTGWPAVRRALEARGLVTCGGDLTDAGADYCRNRLLPVLAVCAFAAELGRAMNIDRP